MLQRERERKSGEGRRCTDRMGREKSMGVGGDGREERLGREKDKIQIKNKSPRRRERESVCVREAWREKKEKKPKSKLQSFIDHSVHGKNNLEPASSLHGLLSIHPVQAKGKWQMGQLIAWGFHAADQCTPTQIDTDPDSDPDTQISRYPHPHPLLTSYALPKQI